MFPPLAMDVSPMERRNMTDETSQAIVTTQSNATPSAQARIERYAGHLTRVGDLDPANANATRPESLEGTSSSDIDLPATTTGGTTDLETEDVSDSTRRQEYIIMSPLVQSPSPETEASTDEVIERDQERAFVTQLMTDIWARREAATSSQFESNAESSTPRLSQRADTNNSAFSTMTTNPLNDHRRYLGVAANLRNSANEPSGSLSNSTSTENSQRTFATATTRADSIARSRQSVRAISRTRSRPPNMNQTLLDQTLPTLTAMTDRNDDERSQQDEEAVDSEALFITSLRAGSFSRSQRRLRLSALDSVQRQAGRFGNPPDVEGDGSVTVYQVPPLNTDGTGTVQSTETTATTPADNENQALSSLDFDRFESWMTRRFLSGESGEPQAGEWLEEAVLQAAQAALADPEWPGDRNRIAEGIEELLRQISNVNDTGRQEAPPFRIWRNHLVDIDRRSWTSQATRNGGIQIPHPRSNASNQEEHDADLEESRQTSTAPPTRNNAPGADDGLPWFGSYFDQTNRESQVNSDNNQHEEDGRVTLLPFLHRPASRGAEQDPRLRYIRPAYDANDIVSRLAEPSIAENGHLTTSATTSLATTAAAAAAATTTTTTTAAAAASSVRSFSDFSPYPGDRARPLPSSHISNNDPMVTSASRVTHWSRPSDYTSPDRSEARNGQLSDTHLRENLDFRSIRADPSLLNECHLLYCGKYIEQLPQGFHRKDSIKELPASNGGGCGALICARAKTEVNVSISVKENDRLFHYISDLPPPIAWVSDVYENGSVCMWYERPHFYDEFCEDCITVAFGCKSCGNVLGLRIVEPCSFCLLEKSRDMFLWKFDSARVTPRHRRYVVQPKPYIDLSEEDEMGLDFPCSSSTPIDLESGHRELKRPMMWGKMRWVDLPAPQEELQWGLIGDLADWLRPELNNKHFQDTTKLCMNAATDGRAFLPRSSRMAGAPRRMTQAGTFDRGLVESAAGNSIPDATPPWRLSDTRLSDTRASSRRLRDGPLPALDSIFSPPPLNNSSLTRQPSIRRETRALPIRSFRGSFHGPSSAMQTLGEFLVPAAIPIMPISFTAPEPFTGRSGGSWTNIDSNESTLRRDDVGRRVQARTEQDTSVHTTLGRRQTPSQNLDDDENPLDVERLGDDRHDHNGRRIARNRTRLEEIRRGRRTDSIGR